MLAVYAWRFLKYSRSLVIANDKLQRHEGPFGSLHDVAGGLRP